MRKYIAYDFQHFFKYTLLIRVTSLQITKTKASKAIYKQFAIA